MSKDDETKWKSRRCHHQISPTKKSTKAQLPSKQLPLQIPAATMKPQNYSLKFQNSLADCRITPGSQHLISRTNAKAPNGSRALRQPTKAELRKAVGRISKDTSARKGPVASSDVSATPLVQLLSKKAQKKAQAQAYAENRAVEKRREVKVAAARKGRNLS